MIYDNKAIDTGVSSAIGRIKMSVGKRKKAKNNSHKGYGGQGGPIMAKAIKGMYKTPVDQMPLKQRLQQEQGVMAKRKLPEMLKQMSKAPQAMTRQRDSLLPAKPAPSVNTQKFLGQLRKIQSGKAKLKPIPHN